MASFKASTVASTVSMRPPTYPATQVATHNGPPGTFAPGTKVQVGNHRVIVEKYLSEGGFAHVYVVNVPLADGKAERAVLKRVAVPDKEALANMKTEVETMKKLKGHKHIVTYIDSHASQLKGGGYEVFLLMEYCAGGGLIDFMNTRLQHRLTEPEILKLFSDVAEGVACMHYLKPPLLHRDLKVENVLISTSGSSKLYKLCDFGSAAPPRPAATNAMEGRLIEDDVQRHTTLQYRSPEMIDVYRKRPIDEKSDIWALGVLLYKLCYYTTPFEEKGQMAILTASFKYPGYPSFSDRTKKLIAMMLTENPQNRPNIYQVLREVCAMRGVEVPIKDIYATRTHSEVRRNQQLPPSPDKNRGSVPKVGAFEVKPVQESLTMPDVTPMRRGRPGSTSQPQINKTPSRSPRPQSNDDPFAALDSTHQKTRAAAIDQIANRYPSLDEFSLLHEKGSRFQAEPQSPPNDQQASLSKRVTAALADEAFAQPGPAKSAPSSRPRSPSSKTNLSSVATVRSIEVPSSQYKPSSEGISTSKRPAMVSVGTMTSVPSSPEDKKYSTIEQRPIWRVPSAASRNTRPPPLTNIPQQDRLALKEIHRSQSFDADDSPVRSPVSSRPSLESPRPMLLPQREPIHRSKSAHSRPRPSLDILRDGFGLSRDKPAFGREKGSRSSGGFLNGSDRSEDPVLDDEDSNIESNVEFLRSMEGDDTSKSHHRRNSSLGKHIKRSSLPSVSLSGTKNILSGKFGDAFRRFESATSGPKQKEPGLTADIGSDGLSTITGSDNYSRASDEEGDMYETEDLSPEMRRELERRRLSQEEKRVADAAAAYRQRLANGVDSGAGRPGGGTNRAFMIQNRVKNLLDESNKPSPTKTAEGYGHYTELERTVSQPVDASPRKPNLSVQSRKPYLNSGAHASAPSSIGPSPAPQQQASQSLPVRPNAPPKPQGLRTGLGISRPTQPARDIPVQIDDWEADFSKRYPRLSLDMVETEIEPRMTKANPSRSYDA